MMTIPVKVVGLGRVAWTNLHPDEVSDSRARATDRSRLQRGVGARSANAAIISVTVTGIPDTKITVYELSRPNILIPIHISASEGLFWIGCPVFLDRRLLRMTP
jgi:hypothetical protein